MSLKQVYLLVVGLLAFTPLLNAHTYSIMIDPAGDAKQTGRIIEDTFERAITLHIAEALKKALEQQFLCSVVITRSPGEIVYPLQNANFANRLSIDLFLSIHCYRSPHEKLSLYLYHFSYGEPFVTQPNKDASLPYDKAHLFQYDITKKHAQTITQLLQQSYAHQFQTHGPYRLPMHSLLGITAPAIALEFFLPEKNDWQPLIQPLAQSIASALHS